MEKNTSPQFEELNEPEGNQPRPLTQLLTSDDDLLIDEFSDEQAFLFTEESILMEGELMTSEMGNIFEDDAISLPSEDSLYHLDEYFTLRAFHHHKKHY